MSSINHLINIKMKREFFFCYVQNKQQSELQQTERSPMMATFTLLTVEYECFSLHLLVINDLLLRQKLGMDPSMPNKRQYYTQCLHR